jgi:hypothetical protein
VTQAKRDLGKTALNPFAIRFRSGKYAAVKSRESGALTILPVFMATFASFYLDGRRARTFAICFHSGLLQFTKKMEQN